MEFSSVSGILSGFLFTSDAALLASVLHLRGPPPAKLRGVWTWLLANGMPSHAQDVTEFLSNGEAVISTVDPNAIPAALLLSFAELFDFEASAGVVGGAATLWLRTAQYIHVATPVEGAAGTFRLTWLGSLHWYTPGIFHTATRDLAGTPYRLLLEQCRAEAQAAGAPYSALGAFPLGMAEAALSRFALICNRGEFLPVESAGGAAVLTRRIVGFARRSVLATQPGATSDAAGSFRQVYAAHFRFFHQRHTGLAAVFTPPPSEAAIVNALIRMASICFHPARPAPGCIDDVSSIDALVRDNLVPLTGEGLGTVADKVDWVCNNLRTGAPAGGGGGGGVAAAAGQQPADPGASSTLAARLREHMITPAFQNLVVDLRAELAATPVSGLKVAAVLASSPLVVAHRFGLGFPLPTVSLLYRELLESAQQYTEQWLFNLSMRLVADNLGNINDRARQWRIHNEPAFGIEVAEDIRRRRFSKVPWLALAYAARSQREETKYADIPDSAAWTQLEHFQTVAALSRRVEMFLGDDSASPNSLTAGFSRGETFFSQNANFAATRDSARLTLSIFLDQMLLSIEETWEPIIAARVSLDLARTKPVLVIPATAACWGVLTQGDTDRGVVRGLIRAAPALAAAAGMSTSDLSYPAGVVPPSSLQSVGASGSRGAGRSRSRSRSPDSERGRSADADRSGPRSILRESGRDSGRGSARQKVHFVNTRDFKYSREGAVVRPTEWARALGVDRDSLCWPVVASTKSRASERGRYCQTPEHPGCRNGKRHKQTDSIRQYAQSIFEGGRRKGVGDRDYTPSDMSARERDQLQAALGRARELEAELASVRGRGDRDERVASDRQRSRSRSRSASRDRGEGGRNFVDELLPGSGDDLGDVFDDPAGSAAADGEAARAASAPAASPAPAPSASSSRPSDRRGSPAPDSRQRGGGGDRRHTGRGAPSGKGRGATRAKGGGRARGKGGRLVTFAGSLGRGAAHYASRAFGAAASAIRPLAAQLPSAVPAFADVARVLLIVVCLSSNSEPAVLLPGAGGLFGAIAPPAWSGTRAHSAVSATATRWVSRLLDCPGRAPRAFYAASQRIAPRAVHAAASALRAPGAPAPLSAPALSGASASLGAPAPSDSVGDAPASDALPHTDASASPFPDTSAPLAGGSPAPCTNFLAISIVDRRFEPTEAAQHLLAPRWVALDDLVGREEYVAAAVAAYRARSYVGAIPSDSSDPSDLRPRDIAVASDHLCSSGDFAVGVKPQQPVIPRPSTAFARESRCFSEMCGVHRAEVRALRDVFSQPGPPLDARTCEALGVRLTAAFSPDSARPDSVGRAAAEFHAIWTQDCEHWRARIVEDDFAHVPEALKCDGALAAFSEPELALVPFATHCRPPVTPPGSQPASQAAMHELGPATAEGFFPVRHFRAKADWWLALMRSWLIDVLGNGEEATAKQPPALVFGQSEMLPRYRGYLWEFDAGLGRFVKTDTSARRDSHLNREFAYTFRVDYDDQYLFHVLDYGVSFAADSMAMQLVFPPHMQSLAAALSKLQKGICERAARGWYDVLPFVSRVPWRPQQGGSRSKRLGGTRLVVNASWPHSDLCDDMGVRVFALNHVSKRSSDEIAGASSSRVLRFAKRLRATSRSPPPLSDAVDGCAMPATRRGQMGRAFVVDAAAATEHPCRIYGGRGSILGNPLCMSSEDDRDKACQGFAALLADPHLSPYAVARQLGLVCHPRYAAICPHARLSFVTLLARKVARGVSVMLVCHCAPRRCHLDHVVEAVMERAATFRASAPEAPLSLPDDAPLVLHLFSGPAGLRDGLAAFLWLLQIRCIEFDRLNGDDLLSRSQYEDLRCMALAGRFCFVVAGIPCHTYSIARHRPPAPGAPAWARPLRNRLLGGAPLPWLTPLEAGEVWRSDTLTKRAASIIRLVAARRGGHIVENPPDREEGEFAAFAGRSPILHSPLWVSPVIASLHRDLASERVNFMQCPFDKGHGAQKATTLQFGPPQHLPSICALGTVRCSCKRHRTIAAGYDEEMRSQSKPTASYPAGLNSHFASAIAHYVRLVWLSHRAVSWVVGGSFSLSLKQLAESDERDKWPKEVKISTVDYMCEDAYLKHCARALGTFVVVLDDDFRDWFYQLRLAADSEWLVGFIILELEKVAADNPQLRYAVEKVVGQGTFVGSGHGQRLCYLVIHMWEIVFEIFDHDLLESDLASSSALRDIKARREAAGLRFQLHAKGGYTDDVRLRMVGPIRGRNGTRAWCFVTKGLRVLMAQIEKRQLGLHDLSLGVHHQLTLGISYMDVEKRDRTRVQLRSLIAGKLPVDEYRSLVGLLLHISFLSGMGKASTHGMFTPFMPNGALSRGPSTLVAGLFLTDAILTRGREWLERLSTAWGATFMSAVTSRMRWASSHAVCSTVFWRSDSCKEGTTHPGIGGVRGGTFWVRPLSRLEADLLPVPVTEFVGFKGNLAAFGDDVQDDQIVVTEIDALTPSFVLSSEAAKSELMQHTLRSVATDPAFNRIRDRMTNGHLSGEANPAADMASRSKLAELHDFLSDAGVEPQQIPYPPVLDALIAELVQLEQRRRAVRSAPAIGTSASSFLNQEVIQFTATQCTVASTPLSDGAPPLSPRVALVSSGPVGGAVAAPPSGRARPRSDSVCSSPLASVLLAPLIVAAACASPFPVMARATAAPDFSDAPALKRARTFSAPTVAHITTGSIPLLHSEAIVAPSFTSMLHAYAVISEQPLPPIIAHSACAPSSMSHQLTQAASMAQRFWDDTSLHALRPASFSQLESLVSGILDTSWDNPRSAKRLNSNMKLWKRYTTELNTPLWRPNASALSPFEREREAVLCAGFIPFALRHMRGRKGYGSALPTSAYKCYLGIRKAHSNQFIDMVSTKMVWTMVQRLCRKHLETYGAESMVVSRKQPFTDACYDALFLARGRHGGVDLDAQLPRAAFQAFTAVLRQTGFRKSELTLQSGEKFSKRHAARSSLRWVLRGVVYSTPPPDLLASPRFGDYAILIPPVSKADPTGAVWGALPIYLHHHPTDAHSAFAKLSTLELLSPVTGEARSHVPLISPDGVSPFTGAQLDRALHSIIPRRAYSWHSARIGLACRLLAAGATAAQIQALCRWQTEDSLRVYARLNPDRYDQLLSSAHTADPQSVSTSSLPPLSDELALRQLLGLSLRDVEAIPADGADP